MKKQTQKKTLIVLGSLGGAAAVGAIALSIWNSKKCRAMRAFKRTNAVIHRIGNVMCKISEATDDCM
ncbi:MAG: hypothetical protein IJW30_06575 [Clostridia bacterium]|nr:hypothetical protein [Clostridia bacterium]MBQ9774313.1 hypothetical protein [Clostridia bacterium]